MSTKTLAITLGTVLTAFAAVAAGAPARALAEDIIKTRGGGEIKADEIVDETYEEVVYKVAGSRQVEPAENVVEVVHEVSPPALEYGEKLMKEQRYAEAAKSFRSASSPREAWARQYLLFYGADCLRLSGDLEGARKDYQKLLAEFPKTRFYPHAKLGIALCALEQKQVVPAREALKQLEEEATSKKLGDLWKVRAQLETARAYEMEGKDKEARDGYGKVAREAIRKYPEIGYTAKVRELALQARQDPGKAVKELEGLTEQPELPIEARAAAWNALGEGYAKQGDVKKALLAHLRVVLDQELRTVASEQPKALYLAAAAFEKLKEPNWQQRAEELKGELRARFGASEWARKLGGG